MNAFASLKTLPMLKRLYEIRHRYSFPRSYPGMTKALKRYKACQNLKPREQIRNEMKACRNFWGCYPLHYFRYDLYRNDKNQSEQQLLDYVPEYFFYDLFLPTYNSRKYALLTDDKNVTDVVFKSLGIRQPATICRTLNGCLFDANMRPLDERSLTGLLASGQSDRVFVKPSDGMGGYGIHVFSSEENGTYKSQSGVALTYVYLQGISRSKDYIIQWGIEQAAELSHIYPHSVNTFRIATENKNSKVRLLCSTLRMGRDGRNVDNSAQGGIIGGINANTGEFYSMAGTESCEYFDRHPDTGFVFSGQRIKEWAEIRDFVIRCASSFPFLTYLGWDIALTDDGPLAIEVNSGFGIDHYQVIIGGLKPILNITDPKLYWNPRH